jgi:hypothetical protein
MLSGECRIDAIPVNGQAVLIDGLRLRLDLRLAPSARPAKTGSGLEQRTSSALLPRRAQRLAALAGLAALLGALALWFAGGTPAPAPPPRALPPPAPAEPAPPARAVAAPPRIEKPSPPVVVAPELRPIVVPPAPIDAPRASADKPAPPVAKSPAPSRPSAPKPPSARPPATDREMLDLFGDTK